MEKEKKAAAQGAFEDRPVFAGKRRAEGGDVSAVGQPPKRRLRVKTRVAEGSVAVPARMSRHGLGLLADGDTRPC